MDELAKCALQIRALKKIISKYSGEINSFEVKSIPELKAFISAGDASVKKVAEKLKQEFQAKSGKEYSQEDLPKLSFAVFHFVSSLEVIGVDLPVSFWFTPSDVLELGAADAFDRCIFLCSLLASFGASAKVHVLETEGGLRHPVVLLDAGKVILFDPYPPAKHIVGQTQTEVLARFYLGEKRYTRSLFEFNSTSYEEFGGE